MDWSPFYLKPKSACFESSSSNPNPAKKVNKKKRQRGREGKREKSRKLKPNTLIQIKLTAAKTLQSTELNLNGI
jgi:hypothetical protein